MIALNRNTYAWDLLVDAALCKLTEAQREFPGLYSNYSQGFDSTPQSRLGRFYAQIINSLNSSVSTTMQSEVELLLSDRVGVSLQPSVHTLNADSNSTVMIGHTDFRSFLVEKIFVTDSHNRRIVHSSKTWEEIIDGVYNNAFKYATTCVQSAVEQVTRVLDTLEYTDQDTTDYIRYIKARRRHYKTHLDVMEKFLLAGNDTIEKKHRFVMDVALIVASNRNRSSEECFSWKPTDSVNDNAIRLIQAWYGVSFGYVRFLRLSMCDYGPVDPTSEEALSEEAITTALNSEITYLERYCTPSAARVDTRWGRKGESEAVTTESKDFEVFDFTKVVAEVTSRNHNQLCIETTLDVKSIEFDALATKLANYIRDISLVQLLEGMQMMHNNMIALQGRMAAGGQILSGVMF